MTSWNGNISALLALCVGNSPVNSPHKGQWQRALMLSLISAWINDWVNNREAGDLRRHRAHYDVTIIPMPAGFCTGNELTGIFEVFFPEELVVLSFILPEYEADRCRILPGKITALSSNKNDTERNVFQSEAKSDKIYVFHLGILLLKKIN